MPEIKEIQVRSLNIPHIPNSLIQSPQAIPPASPVTVQIGTPIVNLPGCVESHPDGGKSKTLRGDDENGVMVYCDSTVPSFNPMEYSPENMTFGNGNTISGYKDDKPSEELEISKPEIPITPPSTANTNNKPSKVECPTPAQEAKEPVGTYLNGYRQRVTGYKLVGNECIQVTSKVSLPQQIIAGVPSAGSVVTTGGIAVVATASALMAKPLADLLLKVVKPTVKKVMKKIAAIRGKQIPVLSVMERRDEQRLRNHAIRKLKGKE